MQNHINLMPPSEFHLVPCARHNECVHVHVADFMKLSLSIQLLSAILRQSLVCVQNKIKTSIISGICYQCIAIWLVDCVHINGIHQFTSDFTLLQEGMLYLKPMLYVHIQFEIANQPFGYLFVFGCLS